MFRIELLCEDKNLAAILRGLAGKAANLKVVPVINAEIDENGKVKEVSTEGLIGLLGKHLKDNKMQHITGKEVARFIVSQGRQANSYSYVINKARKAGILKGTHKKGIYKVTAAE